MLGFIVLIVLERAFASVRRRRRSREIDDARLGAVVLGGTATGRVEDLGGGDDEEGVC